MMVKKSSVLTNPIIAGDTDEVRVQLLIQVKQVMNTASPFPEPSPWAK